MEYQTSRVLWSTTDSITVTSAFTEVIATKGKMREVSVLAGEATRPQSPSTCRGSKTARHL